MLVGLAKIITCPEEHLPELIKVGLTQIVESIHKMQENAIKARESPDGVIDTEKKVVIENVFDGEWSDGDEEDDDEYNPDEDKVIADKEYYDSPLNEIDEVHYMNQALESIGQKAY